LLIVPPWINKFYILDLRPENSFIKWATDQGHSVYVISWINPTEELRHKDFTSYMMDGPLAALEAIKTDIGVQKVNAIGYCLGGTLLSATLAYAAKKNMDSFASATFFTTLVDFEKAGELSVFVDEDQIQAIERKMRDKGFLDGAEMASTFNSLRSNDLIWSFVVSNYLMGKEPFPFDLLFWNSDSTRLPEAMHSFYLRNMYQKKFDA
jgi:polyhydroxyalkanoate synthase